MRAAATYIRLTRKRRYETEEAGEAFLHSTKGPSEPPRGTMGRCVVTARSVGGFEVYSVRPRTAKETGGGAVVYLHGGAYTNEIVEQQWGFVGHLARTVGCEVLVPVYGLAPAHHASEALELVSDLLTDLVAAGRRCVLAGDSAGGGLALAAAQLALPDTRRSIGGLVLIAPWVDLTMANPAIDEIEPHDPWLTRAGLHPIARSWADGIPLDDPRVSPLHGDLGGLPPVEVWVGTRDIMLPDCRELGARMPAGSPFALHVQDGAIHDYPLLPAPEGRAARRDIAARVSAWLAAG
jgi:acetyl esterase/lipase